VSKSLDARLRVGMGDRIMAALTTCKEDELGSYTRPVTGASFATQPGAVLTPDVS